MLPGICIRVPTIFVICAALSCCTPLACPAEATVTMEMRSHGLPDNIGHGAIFRLPFETIPNLSDEDYANSDIGNGVRINVRNGQLHRVSTSVYELLDGLWASGSDEPEDNVFFEDGRGQLLFDLTQPVNVVEFNAYSRHPKEGSVQRFRLYGSSQPIAPSTSGNLVNNGWDLLTNVNMLTEPDLPIDREASFNGIVGVSVQGDDGGQLGQFRFLLFDIRGVGPNGRAGTFYSEIDIVGSPNPIVPPKCDLSADDRCDLVDLQLLMTAGNLVQGVDVTSELDEMRDLNDDMVINEHDLQQWLADAARKNEIGKYFRGDANLNGSFDSTDLLLVFRVGQYEDAVAGNSGWTTGDWNGDTDFTSSDLVAAFRDGGYERGPGLAPPRAVPEPTSFMMLVAGLIGIAIRRWHIGR